MTYEWRSTAAVPAKVVTKTMCGTPAGHKLHRTEHEQPCDPCRIAHNTYQRARYRRMAAAELATQHPAEAIRAAAFERNGDSPATCQARLLEATREGLTWIDPRRR